MVKFIISNTPMETLSKQAPRPPKMGEKEPSSPPEWGDLGGQITDRYRVGGKGEARAGRDDVFVYVPLYSGDFNRPGLKVCQSTSS